MCLSMNVGFFLFLGTTQCDQVGKEVGGGGGREGDGMNPGGKCHIPTHFWVRDGDCSCQGNIFLP